MGRATVDGWVRVGLATVVVALSCCCATAFGSVAAPRIVGGSQAAPDAWPSLAFLVALEDRGDGTLTPSFACTGTVIDPSWVLTAAHCAIGADGRRVPRIVVKTGVTRIDDGGAPYVAASDVRVHPAYDAASHRNDVALVRLSTATAAPPMPLATADGVASGRYVTPVGEANTAGWGATSADSTSMSGELLQAYLEPQGDDTCAAAHPGYDPSAWACAVTPDTAAACRGDSGGPLTVVDGVSGGRVLLGVTSFGAHACSLQSPAFFVRVPSVAPFIDAVLRAAPVAAVGSESSAGTAPVARSSPRAVTAHRPVLAALSLAPRRFRAARTVPAGGARGRAGAVVRVGGSVLSFRLSKASSVVVAVQRPRTLGGRTVWRALGGGQTVAGRSGANRVRLSGRVAGRALRPGRYRVVVRATDTAGNLSAPARAAFEIAP